MDAASKPTCKKDPAAQLSKYKTFNWLAKDDSVAKKYTDFQDKNVKASISKELQSKGFKELATGNADILYGTPHNTWGKILIPFHINQAL